VSLLQPEHESAGEIVAGRLSCAGCGGEYAIRDGIADFIAGLPPASLPQIVNELPPTAWGYERFWRPFALTLLSGEPFSYRRELPLIAGLAEAWRGGLYLDVACSNGLYARALARTLRGSPGLIAAVDHSMPMLIEARRRARAAGLRISFLHATAQALPIATGSAAGVAIGGSLNEIEDVDGCLAEVRRALASDGRFVAMTLAEAGTPPGQALQALMGTGGIQFWAPDELVRLLERYELRTVGRWQYGVVLFTLSLPLARAEMRD
jgi:ubiquinone/menaquinone biosynthesis C-methylase UbiE